MGSKSEPKNATDLTHRLMVAMSNVGATLFRNNVGNGLMIRHTNVEIRQRIIDACTRLAEAKGGSAYRLQFGLCPGSSDLVGFTPVTITPEMVGKTISVFTATEVKFGADRVKQEQSNFINAVRSSGGIGIVARDVDGAIEELRKGV